MQAANVCCANPGSGFDLEADYLSVVALKHEVDLVVGLGAEMACGDWCI